LLVAYLLPLPAAGPALGNDWPLFRARRYDRPVGIGPVSVAIGDLNSDGIPYLALVNWFGKYPLFQQFT